MNMISEINRVLPESVLDEIGNLRDRESSLAWDYGEVANRVYHYMLANQLQYTRLEACGFVAFMVDNHRAPNTILKYALVAEFFANKRTRTKYDFLPFSHFELAMQFGKDWRKVLEKSAALMAGSFGRPPSRAKLEAIFRPEKLRLQAGLHPDEPDYSENLSQVAQAESGQDDMSDLQSFLAALQAKLPAIQRKYPTIAPLLAQAVLLIQEALKKSHEERVSMLAV